MNKFNVWIVFLLLALVCSGQESQRNGAGSKKITATPLSFGDTIDVKDAISNIELSKQYAKMAGTDTVRTKVRATVTDVCKAKGCWMKLQLPSGQAAMVRFKDYGFFVPSNIEGQEVVVNGKAFVEELGTEDQKHYARDAGASEAEIAQITAPKKIYGFEANGVLLIQK